MIQRKKNAKWINIVATEQTHHRYFSHTGPKGGKSKKSDKMYLKILKDFDHYNQLSVDASNDISKKYLHSDPKCVFSGHNCEIRFLKMKNKIKDLF